MRRVSVAIILSFCLNCNLHAQDAQELFKFGKFNFDNQEYTEAIGFLDQAIEKDSLYINAYFLRAQAFYEIGQFYNSILDINKIFKTEKSPSPYEGHYYLARGKSFLALDDFSNASIDFEKSLSLLNDNSTVYYYKALLGFATLNYKEAIEAIDIAITYEADNPDYYALRAKIKIHFTNPVPTSEDYQSILGDINVAIALSPESHEYYLIRSNFLNSMGEVEAALNDYNTVIKLSPKKEEAYTERGVIKMNNYDYRSAALDFTKSIIINPTDERNYRYRGLCYNNLDNHSDAFKDFSKSIDLLNVQLGSSSDKVLIKSTLGETYLLRGHCLNLMGNNAQACRDFLQAHNLGVKKGLNYYRKFCGIY